MNHQQQQINVSSPACLGTFVPGGVGLSMGRGWAWYTQAWSLFTKQPLIWYVFILIMIIGNLALSVVPFVGSLLGGFFTLYSLAALMLACVKAYAGEEVEVSDYFKAFRSEYFMSFLGIVVLQIAFFLFSIAIGLFIAIMALNIPLNDFSPDKILKDETNLIMLVAIIVVSAIPGALLSIMLNFTLPLIVINRIPLMSAIGKIIRATLGNILPFLVNALITLLLMVGCIITLGFGLFVFIPVSFILLFTVYHDLFYRPSPPLPQAKS